MPFLIFGADALRLNFRRWLLAPTLAVFAAGIAACGGGASSSGMLSTSQTAGCAPTTCGAAVTTLTDAAGDFLSYKVKLVSLELQAADGSLVETLPASTSVDLAQLVHISEIISTKQIPVANYVAAKVTVDYTGASILVDDGTGLGVAVNAVDASGAALGTLQLTVQLDAKNVLKISGGKVSRIAFDFNLLASNSVNLSAKTVTVSPVLVASVVPPDTKEIRVRGTLASVDTVNKSYTLQVKPSDDPSNQGHGPLVVLVTDATSFEINGAPLTGPDGLNQLATLPAGTLTVAFGSISSTDQSFIATRVLAGSSVAGVGADHISGNVTARTGNTLTVHGVHRDGEGAGEDEYVASDVTVTIAAGTAVTVEGQASTTPAHSVGEISIGSRIDAFGKLSKDGSGNISLDATSGRVRLDFTRVEGLLNALAAGQITLNVNAIDRQPIGLFKFAGTGSPTGADSDPTKYMVATGALPTTPFTVGAAVQAIGFVAPFGAAPPDFVAATLADSLGGTGSEDGDHADPSGHMHFGAELGIDWGASGTAAPFKVVDSSHLDLDVANSAIGQHHAIDLGPTTIDLKSLSSDPSIVPISGANATLFAIVHRHSHGIDNFNVFADFAAKLAVDLNGTVTAVATFAEGSYDTTGNQFSARRIVVILND